MIKNDKGFTLIELLGVIVILLLISLLAFPPILEQIRKSKSELSSATMKLISSATELYMSKNKNEYPIYNGNVYCISLQTLVDAGELNTGLTDVDTNKEIDLTQVVEVSITSAANIDYKVTSSSACIVSDNTPIPNSDVSGASVPELNENMIPIKWDGIKWVKADKRNPNNEYEWYNYNNKEWANAVLVSSTSRQGYKDAPLGTEVKENDIMAYLVWIPRYKYKLFNVAGLATSPQEIEILFENKNTTKSTGTVNNSYLTHPSFTFGSEELNGYWVGKFETTGTATVPTVKPNITSLTNQNVSTQYTTSQKFNDLSAYGLTVANDSHMMKNMEWGAVAYLTNSKYGKNSEVWINPNSNYITGCAGDSASAAATTACNSYDTTNGVQASTTGNVYGIYDMSGGAWEYVMGAMYSSGNTSIYVASSGFVQATIDSAAMSKYIDKYQYGTTYTDQTAYNRGLLGDATKETRGWYGDYAGVVADTYSWVCRGGGYSSNTSAGILYFNPKDGGATTISFRMIILVNNKGGI